jgi:hypothetical protein
MTHAKLFSITLNNEKYSSQQGFGGKCKLFPILFFSIFSLPPFHLYVFPDHMSELLSLPVFLPISLKWFQAVFVLLLLLSYSLN